MHYILPHSGEGILSPAPAIYASQPATLPSALITMSLQDPTWHMDTGGSSHLNFNASHSIIHSYHRPLHLHNVLVTTNLIEISFISGDLYPVTKPSTSPTAFVSTSAFMWHQRLGHPVDQVPPGAPDPSGSLTNWIVGIVLTCVLPLITYKWGSLALLKNKADTVMETTEHVMETIEAMAKGADEIIDEITDGLPDNSKLKERMKFTPQMHYILPHPGQGILSPAPAIYASQPATLPSALITMSLQDLTWHMDTGFLDSSYPSSM
uniref:Uncharacterized protein n=1 Tax=Tanacetum cinerariifolium TaxID=118510 RepID=A0A6L2KBK7_TANCI|nr:hypothetical protein [Tanacetum cinerariifolium]